MKLTLQFRVSTDQEMIEFGISRLLVSLGEEAGEPIANFCHLHA
jgi:hypothetical protein